MSSISHRFSLKNVSAVFRLAKMNTYLILGCFLHEKMNKPENFVPDFAVFEKFRSSFAQVNLIIGTKFGI